jgi:hypothetical protein
VAGTFHKDILELSVAIELECAAVYEVFAKRFGADDDLSMFWRLYAEAERSADGDSFPSEVEASRGFLDKLRSWRREFDARMPTRPEAFGIAREIEGHTAELHGRTQFFKLYPRFRELFQRMVEEDLSHRDMLVDAERRFSA